MGGLVPRPGIEPVPPALGAQNLPHWTTRELPGPLLIRAGRGGQSRRAGETLVPPPLGRSPAWLVGARPALCQGSRCAHSLFVSRPSHMCLGGSPRPPPWQHVPRTGSVYRPHQPRHRLVHPSLRDPDLRIREPWSASTIAPACSLSGPDSLCLLSKARP